MANQVMKSKIEKYRLTPDPGSSAYQLLPSKSDITNSRVLYTGYSVFVPPEPLSTLYYSALSGCIIRLPHMLVSSWVWPMGGTHRRQ